MEPDTNVYCSITFNDIPYDQALAAVETLQALLPRKSFSVYYDTVIDGEEGKGE